MLDDTRSGHLSTSITDENVKNINDTVLANDRITIREVAEEIGIYIAQAKRFLLKFLT